MEKHICDCEMIHEETVENTRNRMREETEYLNLATLFKMFGDGTRVKILHALELNEMCVCDLANVLSMTKSSISHQLSKMKEVRLVKSRKSGKTVYYSLDDDHISEIFEVGLEHIEHKQVTE